MTATEKILVLGMHRVALVLAVTTASADAANTICTGEPMFGRSYAHRVSGVDVDSGIGDDCFFALYGPIGQQIEKVCHIGDVGLDQHGDPCRVEATVEGNVIKRIIKIERVPQH